jgi:chemotaxis protein histidine kinase CheA
MTMEQSLKASVEVVRLAASLDLAAAAALAGDADSETINAIFCAAHSIKGSAGPFSRLVDACLLQDLDQRAAA